MNNKDVSPIQMAFRLLITYAIGFFIVGIIAFAIVFLLSNFMNIGNVIGREDMLSILVVGLFLFVVRMFAWVISLRVSFKDRYVNSLLLKRTLLMIVAFLVMYAAMTYTYTYDKFVKTNKNEIVLIEKQMDLLENNEKGDNQRVQYQTQIDELTKRNNYNQLVYVTNAGVILLMIPIIWIGMKSVDRKQREA